MLPGQGSPATAPGVSPIPPRHRELAVRGGSFPPWIPGATTASGPSMPFSRATLRSIRWSGALTPQPLAVVGQGFDRLGDEAHVADGVGRRVGLQLPIEPVDEVGRGEPAGVQPRPADAARRASTTSIRTAVATRPCRASSVTIRSAVRRS